MRKKMIMIGVVIAALLAGCSQNSEENRQSSQIVIIQASDAEETGQAGQQESDDRSYAEETSKETEQTNTIKKEEEEFQRPEDYADHEVTEYGYMICVPPRWGNMGIASDAVYVLDECRNEAWLLLSCYDCFSMELENDLMQLPTYFSKKLLEEINIETHLDSVEVDSEFRVDSSELVEMNGQQMLYVEGSFTIPISGEKVPCVYHAYYLLYTNKEQEYYDLRTQTTLPVENIPVYFMMAQREDTCSEEWFDCLDIMITTFRDID